MLAGNPRGGDVRADETRAAPQPTSRTRPPFASVIGATLAPAAWAMSCMPRQAADVRPVLDDPLPQEFDHGTQPRRLGLADVGDAHRSAHDDEDIVAA
jgi:hypothetical protein